MRHHATFPSTQQEKSTKPWAPFFFLLHLQFSKGKTPLLFVLTELNPVISVLYMWDAAEGLWWHLKLLINIRVTEGSPAAGAKLPRQFTSALKSQSPAMRFTHAHTCDVHAFVCLKMHTNTQLRARTHMNESMQVCRANRKYGSGSVCDQRGNWQAAVQMWNQETGCR